jgi:hypothetical protein
MSINGKPAETEEDIRRLSDEDLVMLSHAGGGSARVPGMRAHAELWRRRKRAEQLNLMLTVVAALAAVAAALAAFIPLMPWS